MNVELTAVLGPVADAAKWIYTWWQGRRGALKPGDIVQLRMKWKPIFEQRLRERLAKKLRSDVIVRDVGRLDEYVNADMPDKGISPWFRSGFVGTYHAGIQLHLGWYSLTRGVTGGWRFRDYKGGEPGDLKVALIGFVPYEQIESVDWEGDEYYYFPIIYCHFDTSRKEPYEKIAFCEQRTSSDPSETFQWYTEICDYDEARRLSVAAGVSELM